jgi:hypothetical protein
LESVALEPAGLGIVYIWLNPEERQNRHFPLATRGVYGTKLGEFRVFSVFQSVNSVTDFSWTV